MKLTDVKIGTIESDGGFGFELSDEAKPINQKELLEILSIDNPMNQNKAVENIFDTILKCESTPFRNNT